jgi:hypothetical protein
MNDAGIVGATEAQFVAGLVIGVFLGLLLGPILRSWLAWREWVEASREAELTEGFLARWEEEEDARSDDRPSEARRPAVEPPVRAGRPSTAPPARESGRTTPNGKGSSP